MKIIRIVFFLYLFHIYSSKIFSDTKSTDNPLWQSFSKLNEFKIQFDSLNSFRNNLSTISAILDQKNEIKFSLQSNPKISKKDILCSLIKFNDRIKDIGWDTLSIKTYSNCESVTQAFTAGLLEGLATFHKISDFYLNLLDIQNGNVNVLNKIKQFFEKVHRNVNRKLEIKLNDNSLSSMENKYWSQILLVQAQTEGLLLGFNHLNETKITIGDLYLLNGDGQISELVNIFSHHGYFDENKNEPFRYKHNYNLKRRKLKPFIEKLFKRYETKDLKRIWELLEIDNHCSAMIKLIKDQHHKIKDILVAHSTWDHYSEMLRIYKDYEFHFKDLDGKVTQKKITFSSYPGCISSTDDFYIINSNLIVLETTLDVLDDSSYKKIMKVDNYIPDFMRIMSANYLAKSSNEWLDNLKFINTGTYNSQWMIIDLNKIKRSFDKDDLEENSLIIAEQLPGDVLFADMSSRLTAKGYWASYNVPFFNKTRVVSGFKEISDRFEAQEFNYESNTRGRLFSKYQTQVKDLKTLQKLMLNNNYKEEENGGPGQTIAARFDLDGTLGIKLSGAVDVKVTNYEMAIQHKCLAISGPSRQNLPPFSFEKYPNAPKRGLPIEWKFEWQEISPEIIRNQKF